MLELRRANSFELLLFVMKPLNRDEDFFDTLDEPVPDTIDEADDDDVELFECLRTREVPSISAATLLVFLMSGMVGMAKKLLDDFVSFLAEPLLLESDFGHVIFSIRLLKIIILKRKWFLGKFRTTT